MTNIVIINPKVKQFLTVTVEKSIYVSLAQTAAQLPILLFS